MKKHLSIAIARVLALSVPLKTKFKSTIRAACHPFGGVVCVGVVMLICSSVQAQNLFVANYGNYGNQGNNTISEFTPGGVQSTFASGLSWPAALAFNSTGDLFEMDWGSGTICEFTPGGVQSTFGSGSY